MFVKSGDLNNQLGYRLRELRDWFAGTLEVRELRSEEVVARAKQAFEKWACDEYLDDSSPDLTWAWETYRENTIEWVDAWAKGVSLLETDLEISADPAWEVPEFALVVGIVLVDRALDQCRAGTVRSRTILAIYYADAIAAQESWLSLRGPTRCRSPHAKLVMAEQSIRRLDDEVAIRNSKTVEARRRARIRIAGDPKQAAKVNAYHLWQERREGRLPKLRTVEQFAMEVMRRWPVLTSAKVICGWSAKWTKEAKAAGK